MIKKGSEGLKVTVTVQSVLRASVEKVTAEFD